MDETCLLPPGVARNTLMVLNSPVREHQWFGHNLLSWELLVGMQASLMASQAKLLLLSHPRSPRLPSK